MDGKGRGGGEEEKRGKGRRVMGIGGKQREELKNKCEVNVKGRVEGRRRKECKGWNKMKNGRETLKEWKEGK